MTTRDKDFVDARIAAGGGGGGVTAHTALSALTWASSGHTGTPTRVAAFGGTYPDHQRPAQRVDRDGGYRLITRGEGVDLELTAVWRRLAETGGRRLNCEDHGCRDVDERGDSHPFPPSGPAALLAS